MDRFWIGIVLVGCLSLLTQWGTWTTYLHYVQYVYIYIKDINMSVWWAMWCIYLDHPRPSKFPKTKGWKHWGQIPHLYLYFSFLCKFTWTLTSHPIPPHPTPRVRSINCFWKFTWTLTSHPTPPPHRVRSINCFCKFTWTLTSHPTPPPHRMWFQDLGRAYIYI